LYNLVAGVPCFQHLEQPAHADPRHENDCVEPTGKQRGAELEGGGVFLQRRFSQRRSDAWNPSESGNQGSHFRGVSTFKSHNFQTVKIRAGG
jgi:hypothetical protein